MAELDLGRVVGSQIHNVTGVPGEELGLLNDWAMDVQSGKVYEKTTSGWASRGSFKGPKGDQGEQGPQGIQGAQGPKGDTGAAGPAGVDGKTPALSINASGHLIATYAD